MDESTWMVVGILCLCLAIAIAVWIYNYDRYEKRAKEEYKKWQDRERKQDWGQR